MKGGVSIGGGIGPSGRRKTSCTAYGREGPESAPDSRRIAGVYVKLR